MQPDRTHHERILHHLANAAAALESARTKSIEATSAHLATVTPSAPPPPPPPDDQPIVEGTQ